MAYPQTTFPSTIVASTSLVGRRRDAALTNTLLYQLDVLKSTGRYDAFKLGWHEIYDREPAVWPIPDHLFWDSDVAKWIEGACYFLMQKQIPVVDSAVREIVDMIRGAQQPDGYINIHYTVVQPGKRFSNLRDMHELYNAGHLIEAALAHNQAYKNDVLLSPVLRYVDLLCDTFGPGEHQLHGYPGHPEIELALLRLFDHTKNLKHLDLARYFITERGNSDGVDGRHYYDVESEKRGDDPRKMPAFYPHPRSLWYHQAHQPIKEQMSIEGHSVRAMYLLTATADLVRIDKAATTGDLKRAVFRLWDSMTQRKMYATGGIGAMHQWEGFGIDYFLPQGTDEGGCYAETCASIGVMMLADRILQIERNARFTDIMELCLYNSVLTAMSHDGRAFTYVNQLASSETDLSKREDWFTVACCPPNMLRLLGQIGGFAWSYDVDEVSIAAAVNVNLFLSSKLEFQLGGEVIEIHQDSSWPWGGSIALTVGQTKANVTLRLRIPQWAGRFTLQPPCPLAMLDDGYLILPSEWVANHRSFELHIGLKPRWVMQHPYTTQATISLMRGPVVYCIEDVDNPALENHFKNVHVDITADIAERHVHDEITGDDYVALDLIHGAKSVSFTDNAVPGPSVETTQFQSVCDKSAVLPVLRFVPYYFRANRKGKGQMRVGLKRLP